MTLEQIATESIKKTLGHMAFEAIMSDAKLQVAKARALELEAKVSELQKPSTEKAD